MCEDWLGGDWRNVREFMEEVVDRARARRKRDAEDYSPRQMTDTSVEGMGSAPFPGKRGHSDLCYAYSPRSGDFYVGYSSYSGGMTYRVPKSGGYRTVSFGRDTTQSERRERRFEQEVGSVTSGPIDRPLCNCAEACAVSIAASWGESLPDLVFITFYPLEKSKGGLKDPCENCQTWIKKSKSYWMGDKFHCRDDRGSGGSSGGHGFGTGGSTAILGY